MRIREETTSTPTAKAPAMLSVCIPVLRKRSVSPLRAYYIML